MLGRRETKVYEDTIKQGRTAFLSAPMTAMLEGGVPIFVGTDIVGAVGVSGVKSDQDASIARAGIAALGIEKRLKRERRNNKTARLRIEGVPFDRTKCMASFGHMTSVGTKKAASLAIDDWLVFARRGLNSRVQVVLAG